jgi:hypothetical protein
MAGNPSRNVKKRQVPDLTNSIKISTRKIRVYEYRIEFVKFVKPSLFCALVWLCMGYLSRRLTNSVDEFSGNASTSVESFLTH